jgi:hypothetical protein
VSTLYPRLVSMRVFPLSRGTLLDIGWRTRRPMMGLEVVQGG